MNHIFYVDLPDPAAAPGVEESDYINVGAFPSLQGAQKFLFDNYGMPAEVAAFFITAGEV